MKDHNTHYCFYIEIKLKGCPMKKVKLLFLYLLSGLVFVSNNMHGNDQVVQATYSIFDTNATLLQKADEYLSHIDSCCDLLPPVTWSGTTEAYFEQYIQEHFNIPVTDIFLGSSHTYKIVTQYVDEIIKKNQQYLALARQSVVYRASFFKSMADKLSQIKILEQDLLQVQEYARLYEKFLLGHQVINFYASLPVKIVNVSSNKTYEHSLLAWIYQGYYKKASFPLIKIAMQFALDMEWLKKQDQKSYKEFPRLYEQLIACQNNIEYACNILCSSEVYKKEKPEYDQYMQELRFQSAKDSYEYNQRQVKYYQEQARTYRKKAEGHRQEAQKYSESDYWYSSNIRDAELADKWAELADKWAESYLQDAQSYLREIQMYEKQMIKDLQCRVKELEQQNKKL